MLNEELDPLGFWVSWVKRISQVSTKMTASSLKSRSEILRFTKDAPQVDLSDVLPRIQSIQVLKSMGASIHP